MTLLTPRRIRHYPRIILIVIWAGILLNWLLSSGWRGAGGQILFIDFIVFYSAGFLLRLAPQSLYAFDEQLSLQRMLIAPTPLAGTGPFSHPPYVAALLEPLSLVSLPAALVAWSALSVAALAGALVLIRRLFAAELSRLSISSGTLVAIALSCAPIVAGLHSGQMHTFVLLGALGAVSLTLRGRPWAAGAVAGLLAVKPQLALAFGLLFLARGDVRACVAAGGAFVGLNVMLLGAVGWDTALLLYRDYTQTTGALLGLPFEEGFPSYFLVTPYGFLTGLTSAGRQGLVLSCSTALAAGFVVWFAYDTWRLRARGLAAQRLSCSRALLLPLLSTPYWMMYDAALLLAAWPLMGSSAAPGRLLAVGAALYGWFWIFPLVSGIVGVPLGVAAPVALWIYSAREHRALARRPWEGAAQAD